MAANQRSLTSISAVDLPGLEDGTPLAGCHLLDFPVIRDHRGNLTFIEGGNHLPFPIERVYYLYDVPGGATRAGHAHRELKEVILAISGSFDVVLSDHKRTSRIHLNRSHFGVLIGPMVWRELDNFSSGSVCLALASAPFDEGDYYRDQAEYLRALRNLTG